MNTEKLRGYLVNIIKWLDRHTHYRLGNILRNLTNVNLQEYWDKYFSGCDKSWRDFPYMLLAEFLPPKDTGFSILDIGCGLGDGCRLLKRHFPIAHIEGADFSPVAIKKAMEQGLDINYFVMDISRDNPPRKYDFISLVHILEHLNDPFPPVEKCLKYVNKAVLVITPYVEKFYDPRLYWKGQHRYLFNENTFSKYGCTILKITEYNPSTGYKYIVYKIEP